MNIYSTWPMLVSLENFTNESLQSDSISFALQGVFFYIFEDIIPITFQIILVRTISSNVSSPKTRLNETTSLLIRREISKLISISFFNEYQI